MKLYRILLVAIFLLAFHPLIAQDSQESKKLSLDEGPISDQFEYISKRSGNYRADGIRYEVVREANLFKLKNNVLDSITALTQKNTALNKTINEQEKSITTLNQKLLETTNNLNAVSNEKDNISFFGKPLSKGTFKAILWSIISVLLLLTLFFIYKFRHSNVLTHEAKSSLADLEKEYEDHRRRALEREQKISRELHDERNKNRKIK
ncbi:MAG: tRNA (guanine-N1)-methyltransferase [Flavobacteriaceae bacterium]